MKKIIKFWLDVIDFAQYQGFAFALKYKLGLAKEGVDFFDVEDDFECDW